MVQEHNGTPVEIPNSIAAAWGIRENVKRGPKPGLKLEQVVRSAIKIALTEGLSAVSMGRVAAELGTGPMSLYRYVNSKDELLALMVDIGLGAPPTIDVNEGWRKGLEHWARGIRACYYQHTWALHVPISGPPILPNQVAWMEVGLQLLSDTKLAEAEKMSIIQLLSGYVRNEATLMTTIMATGLATGTPPDMSMLTYWRMLTQITDPLYFPALHRFLASGTVDVADEPDTEFTFGLERILDGIDMLIKSRA